MKDSSLTFRLGKSGGDAAARGVSSLSQVTPSGRTVVTVNRDAYAAALREASKVISSTVRRALPSKR